jgi:TonB family protein
MNTVTAGLVCLTVLGVTAAAQSWQPARVVGLEYPLSALVRGIEGVVEIECYLTEDGRVARGEPLSGDEELASAAIRNVMQWKFRRVHSGSNRVTLVYRFVILRNGKAGLSPGFRFVRPKEIFVTALEIPKRRSLQE